MYSNIKTDNKITSKFLFAALALAGSVLFPVQSKAALLLGTLNFNGNVAISTGSIHFENAMGGTPGTIAFTTSTGDFSLYGGTAGVLKDINNVAFPIPPGSGTLTDFILATLFPPNIHFTMTQLLAGIEGTSGCSTGPNCTPLNSPFNLTNTSATTSTASFTIMGTETDGTTFTPFTGIFTAQFASQFQPILATINGNGTIVTSFSGTIVASAPEPGSLSMLLGGTLMLGLAFGLRKRAGLRS